MILQPVLASSYSRCKHTSKIVTKPQPFAVNIHRIEPRPFADVISSARQLVFVLYSRFLLGGMLLLDEKTYKSLSESKKVLYLLQWLQNLPKVIKGMERVCWCAPIRVGRLPSSLFSFHTLGAGRVEVQTESPCLPAPTSPP